ncbi:MAG: FecR domain-containing protein [Verrucomicrobiota bacterium]
MNSADRKHWADWSERLARGETLSKEEFDAWRQAITTSPQARRDYLFQCELEAALSDAIQEGVLSKPHQLRYAKAQRRSRYATSGRALAAAAAITIGVGIWWWAQQSEQVKSPSGPQLVEKSSREAPSERVEVSSTPISPEPQLDQGTDSTESVNTQTDLIANRADTITKPVSPPLVSDSEMAGLEVIDTASVTRPLTPFGEVISVDGAPDWEPGSEFLSGEHVVENGTVEIKLDSGVRLVVVGPAQFSLNFGMAVELLSGRLSAEVFPSAIGFRIDTAKVSVVDYGTRFAVTANHKGDAAVHVYNGQVSASTGNEEDGEPLSLETGETFRLDPGDGVLKPADFDDRLFSPAPVWHGNIAWLSEGVSQLEVAPREARSNSLPAGDSLIFKEREGVKLRRDLKVNLDAYGTHSVIEERNHSLLIPRGSTVSSYLLHAHNPETRARGEVRFDSPVLGVIYEGAHLEETDRDLGSRRTDYPDGNTLRGVEEGEKSIWIGEDGRSVHFSVNAPTLDQIRILVAED